MDEFAVFAPEIQLDMLHPSEHRIIRVRAADWVETFERLANQAVGEEPDLMLSDVEEGEDDAMGVDGGGSGGGGGAAAAGGGIQRSLDPLRKTFQVHLPRLGEVVSECDDLAGRVDEAKAQIDARCKELHGASQGEGSLVCSTRALRSPSARRARPHTPPCGTPLRATRRCWQRWPARVTER